MKIRILSLFTMALIWNLAESQTPLAATEVRQLSFFNKINYEGKGSLFLEYAEAPSIKIQNSEYHMAENVRTEVMDETLHIWYDFESSNEGPFDHQQIDIFLYYPALEKLTVNGEVRVDAIQPIISDNFELIAEGKIEMRLPMEVANFNAQMEGNMSVIFSGKAAEENISFEGRGSINALELVAEHATINTEGLGSLYLPYVQKITASAMGLSEIVYQKTPACNVTDKGIEIIRDQQQVTERRM